MLLGKAPAIPLSNEPYLDRLGCLVHGSPALLSFSRWLDRMEQQGQSGRLPVESTYTPLPMCKNHQEKHQLQREQSRGEADPPPPHGDARVNHPHGPRGEADIVGLQRSVAHSGRHGIGDAAHIISNTQQLSVFSTYITYKIQG